MTRPSGAHLSFDEMDACLTGVPTPEAQRHLDHCQTCMEQLRADREIAEQIAALPLMGPGEGFAERVMASVVIPDPFAIRSMQATRRRLFATPKSLAASFLVLLIEQPWYSGIKGLIESPGRLALYSGLASFAYLAGLVALRRLLTVPTQQVAHAAV
jgi:hypothetical protein